MEMPNHGMNSAEENMNMHEHPLAASVERDENAWLAAELRLAHFHEDSYGDLEEQVVTSGRIVLKELG